MPVEREERVAVRPLTKTEIDDRIRRLGETIAVVAGAEPGIHVEAESLRPRWIDPAELVRRLAPFIVLN